MAERRASRFVPESLDRKFWVWGGLRPFALFAAALLTVLVVSLIGVFRGEGSEIAELILFNTTFGAFFALFEDGFSFSPATMIAIGFLARASRFLGLVLFGYFAILIVLLTVREYCACLCFGPIAFVVIIIAGELAEIILPEAIRGPVCDFVLLVSFFGVIIGTEYYRERLENPEEEVAPAPAPGHSIMYDMGNFEDLP